MEILTAFKIRTYLLVTVFWLLGARVYAQDYAKLYFDQLNSKDGLLSDVVNSVSQDANGFLWFATSEGIARYDGYEFQSFKDYPGFDNIFGINIRCLKFGKDGNIYIGSDQGFYAFSKSFEPIFQLVTKQLKGMIAFDIHVANDGFIYIATNKGFFVLRVQDGYLQSLSSDGNNGPIYFRHIVEDHKGRIWVGSWKGGLFKLNPDRKSFTVYKMFKSGNENDNIVNSLLVDSHGYLWVGTWAYGIYVLDISSPDEVHLIKRFTDNSLNEQNIPSNIILSMAEDEYNSIWVGTPSGAAVIRYPFIDKYKIFRYQYSKSPGTVSGSEVTSIFCDSSGLMWLSTKGGGVDKVHIESNKFDHFEIPILTPKFSNQSVYAINVDSKNRILMGVLSLGFVVYDPKSDQFYQYKEVSDYKIIADSVDINTVTSFLWDKDSVLWIGTRYHGVIMFDPARQRVTLINHSTYKDFEGREVSDLYLGPDGTVWVCTENGLHAFQKGDDNNILLQKVTFSKKDLGISGEMDFTGIVKYKDKYIVASGSSGLFQLDIDKGRFTLKVLGDRPNMKVTALFKDSKERIWVATRGGGLLLIDEQELLINPFHKEETLLGDVVNAINEDNYGNIWLTTNKGLARLTFNEGNIGVKAFAYIHGLQGNIFIPRAFYKDRQGNFNVGCYNGAYRFDPLQVTLDDQEPPVVITDVQVAGKKYTYIQGQEEPLQLDHINNDFSVEFSSLSYLFPEGNQYAYMLKGVDRDWKYVGPNMRSANYSNLGPGNYIFKVKGSNSMGGWNETPTEMFVTVKRAPYKTWWAYSIYIILVSLVLWTIYMFKLRAERMKQRLELQAVEKSKSDKINQFKLQFFTNISHEFLTPLSILASAIENSKKKKEFQYDTMSLMERNVQNLNRQIRQLLAFRKIETGNSHVRLENVSISGFIRQCADDFTLLAEKKEIHFKVEIEDGIDGVADKEKIEIIIHNLLSNAFRYTNKAGTVCIRLNKSEVPGFYVLKVEDTGRGIKKEDIPNLFNRFFSGDKRDNDDHNGVGIGLNLTKSLIDLMNGRISVQSEIGKETVFTLELPYTEEGFKSADFVANEEPVNWQENIVIDDQTKEEPILSRKYTLLVVEDNEDFRTVLCQALKEQFYIIEACDGEEALNLLKTRDIDLVVSDIMMPRMSGQELCREVKSNINTSHIPVILLTAKVGEDSRLQGYYAGADSYIEKPVNSQLLIVRIASLLQIRENLKKTYKSSLILEPENISVTPIDEKFIRKAKEIVEHNISNPEFSIKMLADELNASNSMLYRKMTNLVGLTPNEFLRNVRLKQAAKLLENSSFSISEVAYASGFNDLSYFGGCFKKMYGVTPSAYKEGERKN